MGLIQSWKTTTTEMIMVEITVEVTISATFKERT